MKPYKSIELPTNIAEQLGSEWAGVYTVHILMADEYMLLIEKTKLDMQMQNKDWNGVIPESKVCQAIVSAAVTFKAATTATKDNSAATAVEDNSAAKTESQPLCSFAGVPAKLYELLASVAIPINTLSQAEGQRLYSLFR